MDIKIKRNQKPHEPVAWQDTCSGSVYFKANDGGSHVIGGDGVFKSSCIEVEHSVYFKPLYKGDVITITL